MPTAAIFVLGKPVVAPADRFRLEVPATALAARCLWSRDRLVVLWQYMRADAPAVSRPLVDHVRQRIVRGHGMKSGCGS